MASLPIFQPSSNSAQLMQAKWSAVLNPLLSNPITQGIQLTDILLAIGNNQINTTLGRIYKGYIITKMNGAYADIYATTSPDYSLYLVLNSTGSTTVDIYVY